MFAYIFLIIAGIFICAIMLRTKAKNNRIIKMGYKADATIIDFKQANTGRNSGKFPVVRFVTASEETVTLVSSESYLAGKVKKGKKLKVWYDPLNPKDFLLVWPDERISFILAILFGILFILGGIVFILNAEGILHLFKK